MNAPTPPDQPEDAALLHYLKMELVPSFTDAYIDEWTSDSTDIEGLHKIIDNFAVRLVSVFHEHSRQAVQAAERKHEQDLRHFLSDWPTFRLEDGGKAIRLEHIEHRLKLLLQPTQPPAADTTKQGEGESDE